MNVLDKYFLHRRIGDELSLCKECDTSSMRWLRELSVTIAENIRDTNRVKRGEGNALIEGTIRMRRRFGIFFEVLGAETEGATREQVRQVVRRGKIAGKLMVDVDNGIDPVIVKIPSVPRADGMWGGRRIVWSH